MVSTDEREVTTTNLLWKIYKKIYKKNYKKRRREEEKKKKKKKKKKEKRRGPMGKTSWRVGRMVKGRRREEGRRKEGEKGREAVFMVGGASDLALVERQHFLFG